MSILGKFQNPLNVNKFDIIVSYCSCQCVRVGRVVRALVSESHFHWWVRVRVPSLAYIFIEILAITIAQFSDRYQVKLTYYPFSQNSSLHCCDIDVFLANEHHHTSYQYVHSTTDLLLIIGSFSSNRNSRNEHDVYHIYKD